MVHATPISHKHSTCTPSLGLLQTIMRGDDDMVILDPLGDTVLGK